MTTVKSTLLSPHCSTFKEGIIPMSFLSLAEQIGAGECNFFVCHSERSEESLQLACTLLRCDSSLRSERSYEINQCVCFACGTNDRIKETKKQVAKLSLRDQKDCIQKAQNDKQSSPFEGGRVM